MTAVANFANTINESKTGKPFQQALFRPIEQQIKEEPEEFLFADKPIEKNKSEDFLTKLLTKIKSFDRLANSSAIVANLFGAACRLIGVSDGFRNKVTKLVDWITNLSFIPYGLDGARIAIKNNKNLYSGLGFITELISVWCSNVKTKFLIRGLGTGLDQIWVSTDKYLEKTSSGKIKDGKFSSFEEGLTEVPRAVWKMIQEIMTDPKKTLLTINTQGHHALISTLLDILSTVGFAITGNEKLFGLVRDFGASFFDWEMLFRKTLTEKLSGALFIGESILDNAARYFNENNKLLLNHLAHVFGRSALHLYKASNAAA